MKQNRSSLVLPRPNIDIFGGKPVLSKKELLQERTGLLKVLAAIIEDAGGRLLISNGSFGEMKSGAKRTIQIVPGPLGLALQFDTFTETEAETNDTHGTDDAAEFYNSDVAREAREFLRLQRNEANLDPGGDIRGVAEAEPGN